MGRFSFFCRIELIIGDWLVLTWKASFSNCFCWFALCFWEIMYMQKTQFSKQHLQEWIFWRLISMRRQLKLFKSYSYFKQIRQHVFLIDVLVFGYWSEPVSTSGINAIFRRRHRVAKRKVSFVFCSTKENKVQINKNSYYRVNYAFHVKTSQSARN